MPLACSEQSKCHSQPPVALERLCAGLCPSAAHGLETCGFYVTGEATGQEGPSCLGKAQLAACDGKDHSVQECAIRNLSAHSLFQIH